MIVISIRFLAGRYHATPWGRHVNEGAVEWPPSPWRILRALVATWKRTLPDLPQDQVEPILRTLCESPPQFILPPASTAHTRHYMPWHKNWKPPAPINRTLVFDTFVAVSPDATLLAQWPDASLDEPQRNALERIVANLNTLGRSESWCEAELLSDDEAARHFDNGQIHHVSAPLNGEQPSNTEIVRLLCPDPESAFADDHVVTVTTKKFGRGKNKRTKEERSTIYDPAWNLCMETLQLHKERWSDPPGSRWIMYTRSRDCFKNEPASRPRLTASHDWYPQVVRFALDSTVLPLVTQTLPVAEAARRALLYHLADIRGRQRYGAEWDRRKHNAGNQPVSLAGVLSGKDENGKPLTGHNHTYYLPTDEDGDGRIDHLTIVARDGFDADEMRAMDRIRQIKPWGRDNASHPLRVLMLGFSRLDEYRPLPLKSSREWVSATPYVATRYAKTRGPQKVDLQSSSECAEFLIADLREQLCAVRPDLMKAMTGMRIEPLPDNKVAGRWRPIQFKRSRSKHGDGGGRRLAGGFRMRFSLEVQGPMVLGWSCHFGMGLFVPDMNCSTC